MNSLYRVLFVLSLFALVNNNNNVVHSADVSTSSSATTNIATANNDNEALTMTTTSTAATTKEPSVLRSLWTAWTSSSSKSTTTTSSSSTSSYVRTNTNQQQAQPPPQQQPKCQLCHDGSYPKNPTRGVVVSFYAFSYTGTCGNLYYELSNRPVLKSDAICNPLQDRFDWTCGCNPNYVTPQTPSGKVNLGTGFGTWGGW